MRYTSLVLALLLLAACTYAQEPKAYQSGKVLQMDSVQCSVDGKDANSSPDEGGKNSRRNNTEKKFCQDYLIQAEQVVYRIRPKNSKHPILLPVGEWAQFRLVQEKMLLRAPSPDNKEREYIVVSIAARGDSSAETRPVHLNHLQ